MRGDAAFRAAGLLMARAARRPVALAHTDFHSTHPWPSGRIERTIERDFKRPGHALEGAWLTMQIAEDAILQLGLAQDKQWQALRAVVTAVAQHHSPGTGLTPVNYSLPPPTLALGPSGRDELARHFTQEAIESLSFEVDAAVWEGFLQTMVHRDLAHNADDWQWRPMDSIIQRICRLADQRGTSIGAHN